MIDGSLKKPISKPFNAPIAHDQKDTYKYKKIGMPVFATQAGGDAANREL